MIKLNCYYLSTKTGNIYFIEYMRNYKYYGKAIFCNFHRNSVVNDSTHYIFSKVSEKDMRKIEEWELPMYLINKER